MAERHLDRLPARLTWPAALLGVAGVALAGWRLLTAEPFDVGHLMAVAYALLALAVVAAVLAVVAWRRRDPVLLAPAVGVVVLVAALVGAPRVHWVLSEDDLATALEVSAPPECSWREPCRIGWWEIEEVEPDDELPTAWVAGGACYAGHGLARPDPALDDEAVRRLAEEQHGSRGFVEVEDWYGDWVLICVTT